MIGRAAIESLLTREPDVLVIGSAGSLAEAVSLVPVLQPDILLLNVSMSFVSELAALEQLAQLSRVSVVLLTAFVDDEQRAFAYRAGVKGILQKDGTVDSLLVGIRAVASEQCWPWGVATQALPTVAVPPVSARAGMPVNLTAREREVLAALMEGGTNADIARRLRISGDTVKHHITNLLDKTGASNRLELVIFAVRRRLLAD